MIGFCLIVNKNTNSRVKLLSRQCESPTNLDARGEQGIHIFDDDCSQIVQLNGYTIFNIGTLIYKNKWQKKALELIIRDLNNGKTVREIMPNTRGQFCLIVHTSLKVFVITDKLGSFPIFKFEDNDKIQISNIFLLLARHNRMSVDYQSFAEYLTFDYCFGRTFFNEVEHLNRGSIYRFDPHLSIEAYDDFLSGITFNKYKNLEETARIATETLQGSLSFLDGSDRIFVDLTGGFDTRTTATFLRGMDIHFETGICGEQVLGESNYARGVADALQVPYHSDIKIEERTEFRRIVDKHFQIGNGVPILYHSSELIKYYEQIERDFDIHITGFAGTQLFDQFLPRLGLFTTKLKTRPLIEKVFGYNDIIKNTFLSRTAYYEALRDKIDELFKMAGTCVHDELACLFSLSTFNKYYHGCLAGTHNVIMPFYSPFLESELVRVMAQAAYKLKQDRAVQRALLTELNQTVSMIMTSHGYSANINSRTIESLSYRLKKHVKNLSRRVIYELMFPVGIMRHIENVKRKITRPAHEAEVQRSFWVSEIDEIWTDDMEIFEVIDRDKLNKCLARVAEVYKLKAKMLYLNRIINECDPKL